MSMSAGLVIDLGGPWGRMRSPSRALWRRIISRGSEAGVYESWSKWRGDDGCIGLVSLLTELPERWRSPIGLRLEFLDFSCFRDEVWERSSSMVYPFNARRTLFSSVWACRPATTSAFLSRYADLASLKTLTKCLLCED